MIFRHTLRTRVLKDYQNFMVCKKAYLSETPFCIKNKVRIFTHEYMVELQSSINLSDPIQEGRTSDSDHIIQIDQQQGQEKQQGQQRGNISPHPPDLRQVRKPPFHKEGWRYFHNWPRKKKVPCGSDVSSISYRVLPNNQLIEGFQQFLQNLEDEGGQPDAQTSSGSPDSSHYESPQNGSEERHSEHSGESHSSGKTGDPNASFKEQQQSGLLEGSSSKGSSRSVVTPQKSEREQRTSSFVQFDQNSSSSPESEGEEQDAAGDITLVEQPPPSLPLLPRACPDPSQGQSQAQSPRLKKGKSVIAVTVGKPRVLVQDVTGLPDNVTPPHLPSVGPLGQLLEPNSSDLDKQTENSSAPAASPP